MKKVITLGTIIAVVCICSIFMIGVEDTDASVGHGSYDAPLANITTDAYTFLGSTTETTYDKWYLEPFTGTVSISVYDATVNEGDVLVRYHAEVTAISGSGSEYLTLDNGAVSGTVETDVADISITVVVVIGRDTTTLTNKIVNPMEYTHEVRYDTNGGTYDVSPPGGWVTTVTDEESGYTDVLLSTCLFYNTGYDFIGWDIEGTVYQPGDSVPVEGNEYVTAYALWGKLYKHTIVYNGNGGGANTPVQDSVRYTAERGPADVTLSQNPYSKSGQSFIGWEIGGTIYLPGQSAPVEEDSTVTAIAQWTDNSSITYTHTIQYNAGGGTGTTPNTVVTDYIDGISYVTLSNSQFSYPGYDFAGWQIGTLVYSEGVAIPIGADASVTATAQWELTTGTSWDHTIKYDLNGSNTVIQDSVITDNHSCPTAVSLTTSVPIKYGFTFLGWRMTGGEYIMPDMTYGRYNGELLKVVDDGLGNLYVPSVLVEGGESVYAVAQWRDNSQYTHTIRYLAGEGQGTMADTVLTDHYRGPSYVTLSANGFVNDGFVFSGWKIAEYQDITAYSGESIPVEGSNTIYAVAQWELNSPRTSTITYDANGGTGTMADTVKVYYDGTGAYVRLSTCEFIKTGYVFAGWLVDGTNKYAGESVWVDRDTTKTATAQWTAVTVPTYLHSIAYTTEYGSDFLLPSDSYIRDTNSGESDVTLKNGVTRQGFTFIGWLIDGEIYQPYDLIPVEGNSFKTAVAQWSIPTFTHTIIYNAGNGGSGTMDDTIVVDINNGDTDVMLDNCDFTHPSLAFKSWVVEDPTTGQDTFYSPYEYVPVAGNRTVTAMAVWGTFYHEIYYDAGGGTGTMSPTTVTDLNSGNTYITLSSNGFTREGYSFVGWDVRGTIYQPGDSIAVPGDKQYIATAQWVLIQYTHTITYDANGGTGTMTNTVVTDTNMGDTNVPLANNLFTKTGYDFTGWNVGGTIYQSGASVPVSGNATVTATAEWSYVYTHTLRYNANGGTGTMADTVITDYNASAVNISLLPNGFTFTGSTFIGWLVNGNVLQPGDTVPVAGDSVVVATAQWDVITYRHAITYNANGGTGTMADTEIINTTPGPTNVTLAPNGFTNVGYNFVGWRVDSNILQPGQTVAVEGDSSVTAVAQWVLAEYTHTITYDANGGTGTMTNTVVTDNNIGDTYVILAQNGFRRIISTDPISGEPTAEYNFAGWLVGGDLYQPGQSVAVAGDTTVTAVAKWVTPSYTHTITYRPNGGTGTMADTVVTDIYARETNVTLASNGFTRTGYNFIGWLVNGNVLQPGDTVPVAGDSVVVATAQWTEEIYTHTITYNANGGNGVMNDTVITNNVSGAVNVTLESNEFTRAGYIFTGWSVNGTIYQPGDSVPVGGGFVETAYAQWSENALPTYYHTIRYSPNGGLGYMSDTTIVNTTSGYTNVPLATCGFVRTGYDFAGWTVNGTSYSEGDTVPVAGDSDVTAIAQWVLSTYTHTVTYNSNGGIGTMSDSVITNNVMGNTLITLATCGFVKAGYSFSGWDHNGIIYQPGQTLPVAGNMVEEVYAQWTAVTYTHTITYDPNGASGTMQDTIITNVNSGNTAVPLAPNEYTYEGWTFKGWLVGGAVYQPGQTVLVTGGSVITAVAQWSENILSVSVNNITGMSDGEYQTQINAVPNNNGQVTYGSITCTGGTATVTSYGLVSYNAPHVTSQTEYTITVGVTATFPDGYVITQDAIITATINPLPQSVVITNGTATMDSESTDQGGYHIEDVTFNGETCEWLIAPQYTEVTVENDLDGTLIKTLIGIIPLLMLIGIVIYIARRMTVSSR